MPFQADRRVQEQSRETELETRLLRIELDVLMAEAIQADSALLELFRLGEFFPHLSEQFHWLERSQWDSIAAVTGRELIGDQIGRVGGLVPWMIENLQRIARLEHQVQLAEDLLRDAEQIRLVGRLGKGTGGLLLLAGFGLWFTRVQVYQDRILERESATPNRR